MTRSNLRPRYVVYDENGDRIGRISVGHNGEFEHSDVDSEMLTAVPSHQINKKNISDKEVADIQTRPLSQTLARTRYNNINGKTDDWVYECPLFRQPVDNLEVSSGKNVSRDQWILSSRGDSRDADPHLYVSTLARFKAQKFVPKWALEDIADRVGLDGYAQIMSYIYLQLEREIFEAAPDEDISDEELYIHVADRYRFKFTAKELEKLETLVPQKLEENEDNIIESMFGQEISLFDKYKKQWAQILGSQKTISDADWWSYSFRVEGPDFNSVDEAEEWITELENKFDEKWDELLEKVENGEISVTSDKITPRPVYAIDDPQENVSVTAENNSDHKCVVYREWWQIDDIPALSMYCPNCGNKVYTDHGEHHTFDYSFKIDCHNCDMRLTPYNIITNPRNEYNMDEVNADTEMVEMALKSYWNRAMRYGFRLGDRIAVDLRAYEFNYYAEQLNIEWSIKCPLYKKPIEALDNEGLDDVEYNHTRYEGDRGASRKQMAEGFTLSRSAHDVVHMNMKQSYFEKSILGNYGEGDAFDVDWLEFQVHELVRIHQHIFESMEGESVKIDNEDFLNHLRMYYDLEDYSNDWVVEAYEKVNRNIDDIKCRYENHFDNYCEYYITRNEKGLNTKEDVKEFMKAKEERNEKYLTELKERAENGEIEVFAGDQMGITHPLVKQYE